MSNKKFGHEIATRLQTAFILIPLVLFFTYLGGIFFWFLIAAFAFVAFAEYLHLVRRKGFRPPRTVWVSFFLILLLVPFKVDGPEMLITWLMPFMLLAMEPAYLRERGENSDSLAVVALGLLVISAGIYSIWLLRANGFSLLVYFFFLIWAFDTGGYLFGRFFGRKRLAPHSSPKKSVEGLIGGYIFAFALAALVKFVFDADWLIPRFLMHLLTVFVVTTVAQLGDLAESVWKREAGVKDSSALFPGHGGALDRIDSIVFSAPFFLVLKTVIG